MCIRDSNILNEIIEAPPTDGLWDDGRNDIEQLGMSYEDLELQAQMWDNGYLQEIISDTLGEMRVPGPPVRMSETPPKIQGGGPRLGFDTETILLQLGYDWDQITSLRDREVI